MAKNLSGKKALVTGAGGGIGQAIVESLKAHAVTVAGTDQNACPNSDVSIVGNLMDAAFCDALPSKAHEQLGGLDIGINNAVEDYLAALEEHKPDILGMSALLTTTMPYMKVVIDTLVEKGMRENYIVLVGGAPLNEEFGQAVGADAYCRDAAEAAPTAVRTVQERQLAQSA